MEGEDSFGRTEEFSNIELDIDDWINIVDELLRQTAGYQNELDCIELHSNEDLTNATDEPAAEQTIIS
ncbi:23874_t:CDS:2 [Dentiscutata erythropus]|uniref:23874_t:CDS:1 n=1 Tax=Dentiscutata erythropus TaxID=1348616 RepID=A0A9N9NRL5_9GLOM|nr:23874_t:CDS:2 [Dentiscutata erythropus]